MNRPEGGTLVEAQLPISVQRSDDDATRDDRG
jgi:hypothetical protein